MNTNDTGDNPIKSNVSLDALGAPNTGTPPIDAPLDNGAGTPPDNGGQGTPPTDNGTPPNTGTPPANDGGQGTPPAPLEINSFADLLPHLNNSTDESVVEIKNGILSLFKGAGFDAHGNVLGQDNQILLSAENFKNYVDNDQLPLNDKGEVINALGQVVGKIEADTTPTVDVVRTKLQETLGVQFTKPELLTLEDTEENLVLLAQEAANLKSVNAIRSFLDGNPDVKGLYQHLRLGGTPDTYSSSAVDYKAINVKTLEESGKIDLLNRAFSLQGVPNKDALIKLVKDAGEETLNSNVAEAVRYLENKQKETNASRTAQLEAIALAEEKETEAYWEEVNKLVTNGKVGDIMIPATDREGFFKYMSTPVNDEMVSADDLKAQEDSLEFQTLVSYLRYKGGDISKLVKAIVRQEQVTTLKSRAARLKGLTENGQVPITGNQGGPSGLSLNTLFP